MSIEAGDLDTDGAFETRDGHDGKIRRLRKEIETNKKALQGVESQLQMLNGTKNRLLDKIDGLRQAVWRHMCEMQLGGGGRESVSGGRKSSISCKGTPQIVPAAKGAEATAPQKK